MNRQLVTAVAAACLATLIAPLASAAVGLDEAARLKTELTPFGAEKAGMSVEDYAARQAKEIPAGRLGTTEEFGAACAFLCSAHAGYITGQNLRIDGGLYPSAF